MELKNVKANALKMLVGEILVYRAWYFSHRKKLERYRGIHKGGKCFIIGNGPSLNNMDLSLLDGCITIGLNKIYMIFDRVKLHLDYHVAVNRFVIEQGHDIIEKLPCPSFLSYRASRGVVENTANINYLYTGAPWGFDGDITKRISEGYTVTYVAMQLAFFMGFKEVYLIGVDHNFVANGAPNEVQLLEGSDSNHFDPNYFKGDNWQLPDLAGSELAYHLADFHYKRAGRKIYDATEGGKCENFQKISFKEAVAKCRTDF